MGPYCQFCDHRCFVERIIPNPAPGTIAEATGGHLLMATCATGMAHDRRATGGLDHTTAINPREEVTV